MPASAAAARAKTEKKKATEVKKEETKKSYVPPPPPDGAKIQAPAGVPPAKTFPISNGPCPKGMSIPNVAAAPP